MKLMFFFGIFLQMKEEVNWWKRFFEMSVLGAGQICIFHLTILNGGPSPPSLLSPFPPDPLPSFPSLPLLPLLLKILNGSPPLLHPLLINFIKPRIDTIHRIGESIILFIKILWFCDLETDIQTNLECTEP